MPEISIIVPVYNAEDYLVRCLDSIKKQNFTEWECILVNDGSTDNSQELIDCYVAKDSRIIALQQENQGLSGARNTALQYAKGEYSTWAHQKIVYGNNVVHNFSTHQCNISSG